MLRPAPEAAQRGPGQTDAGHPCALWDSGCAVDRVTGRRESDARGGIRVDVIEFVAAAVFAGLAARSAHYWATHRFGSRDALDDALFAVFVMGRVGTWLLASVLFSLFGTISARGRAYTDEARQYSWLLIVFIALGAMQLLAGWFLGARASEDAKPGGDDPRDEPRPPIP
jgi:hypothetical protein